MDSILSYIIDVVDMAKKTAAVTARVDPEVKENAERILSQLGLSASTAIDVFYRQVILTGGIPFEIVVPNPLPRVSGLSSDELRVLLDGAIEKTMKDNEVFTGFDAGSDDE